MRIRRVAKFSLAALVVAVTVVALLSVTPPQPVARRILLAVSDRVLFAPSESKGARFTLHKLVGMYLEYMIAGKMARTAAARTDSNDDVARIAFVLRRARVRMVDAEEVPHTPQDWPVLVAGVGYCDQINAAVARILAHSFPRAQLFALRDPVTGASPHTIGRVWSPRRKEWLYFDGFHKQLVFRKTAGGVEILSNAGEQGVRAETLALYRMPGWVMNEYPPTFPRFLAHAISMRLRHEAGEALPRTASAPVPQSGPGVAPPPVPPLVVPPMEDEASHRVARTYVRARADDLFGDPEVAKKEYRAVAIATGDLDPRVKILQAAAERFGQP